MCGFTGFLTTDLTILNRAHSVASLMAMEIKHRGPDDAGAWNDSDAGIALGFRRLSILDLSIAGHQPMHSVSGRFVMTFNGEIYNHTDLRNLLETSQVAKPAHNWRGHSDSETLLACFEAWGIEETLKKTVGMFAIATWDTQSRTLHLARDRFGEKPLYYGWAHTNSSEASTFVFGSELKAIRKFHNFSNLVCRQALAQYMRYMYVPAPLSIYKDIYKLEPGCLLTIRGESPISPPSQPIHPPGSYQSLTLLIDICLQLNPDDRNILLNKT